MVRSMTTVAALAFASAAAFAEPTLEEGFRNPPNEAKPHLWWHWMNGNVTKEGITADLESMAEVGIGGAQIFDAGCGIPPGPVEFDSAAWYEMFTHAAKEANRLGIELCHANCSGWSSSGGPWITPEKSMKWLLETGETPVLRGPCRFEDEVPRPTPYLNAYAGKKVGEDYYRDIAVLAVPALKPVAGTTNALRLSEWKAKTFIVRKNDCLRDGRLAGTGEAIDKARIVDLSDRFDPKTGRVDWDVPAGEWKILRIGYGSNGQRNFPASKNGFGLEVDKLSESAVRFHMEQYCERLVKALGPYAGNHPYGLNNILVDSYEVGSQNWTDGFERTFETARGYSLKPYLPLLAGGYVVGSVEESERFLEDFRRVIADEFAKNYCGGLAKKCHELGLRLSVEPYGNCPADNLQYGMYSDIPTAECWSHGQHRNYDDGNARLAAHVAHAWGRRYVAMEAFTGEPTTGGRWTVTPFSIKSQGDLAYADGVNRVVYHRFVHQPWKDPYRPGLTMGRWGMHYERSNTWWYEQKEWLKYQARCQWMLQEGKFHADILYYYGEGAPNVRSEVYWGLENPKDVPEGYDYDQCSRDVVLGLEVKDGRLVNVAGISYAVLVLPPDDFMSLEMIRKVEALADAGAMIVGTIKPVRAPGLSKDSDEVRRIADRIWGVKVKTVSVNQALALVNVGWDCLCETPIVRKAWIHRTGEDGSDWYFVAAQNPDTLSEIRFSFPETGRTPELWNPETGTIERAGRSEVDWRGRRLVVIRDFPPDGSMFVVFRGKAENVPVEKNWRTVASAPVNGPWTISFPAGWKAPASVTLPALCSWTDYPDAGVRYFSGTATYATEVPVPRITAGERILIDLGVVKHFAQVTVNGRAYPSLWRPPFVVDITDAVSGDALKLEVRVTNLWPNRLIGDDIECAEDCTWQKNAAFRNRSETGIVELPDWVKNGGKSPTGRCTFTTWKHWTKDDEPLESGLLGPVRLKVRGEK